MIKNSTQLASFDSKNVATNKSFFTGALNLQNLDFDPLITGYAFIIWKKVPQFVTKYYKEFAAFTQKNFKAFSGLEDMELQTQSYQYGFNNNDYNVAAGITKNNTEFTIRHQEYSGNPVKNMYQFWVSGMADPDTGIATYPNLVNSDYGAKHHTGELLYVVTRPDAANVTKNNIEFAAFYTNVMPKKIPLSHFEYTQGEHNLVELEITFTGNLHISANVDNYARQELKNSYGFRTEGQFNPKNANAGSDSLGSFKLDI